MLINSYQHIRSLNFSNHKHKFSCTTGLKTKFVCNNNLYFRNASEIPAVYAFTMLVSQLFTLLTHSLIAENVQVLSLRWFRTVCSFLFWLKFACCVVVIIIRNGRTKPSCKSIPKSPFAIIKERKIILVCIYDLVRLKSPELMLQAVRTLWWKYTRNA